MKRETWHRQPERAIARASRGVSWRGRAPLVVISSRRSGTRVTWYGWSRQAMVTILVADPEFEVTDRAHPAAMATAS